MAYFTSRIAYFKDALVNRLFGTILLSRGFSYSILFAFALLLAGCLSPKLKQDEIQITVNADEQSVQYQLPAGSNVEEALNSAGINFAESDRVEPPLYTLLADGEQIQIVRSGAQRIPPRR